MHAWCGNNGHRSKCRKIWTHIESAVQGLSKTDGPTAGSYGNLKHLEICTNLFGFWQLNRQSYLNGCWNVSSKHLIIFHVNTRSNFMTSIAYGQKLTKAAVLIYIHQVWEKPFPMLIWMLSSFVIRITPCDKSQFIN